MKEQQEAPEMGLSSSVKAYRNLSQATVEFFGIQTTEKNEADYSRVYPYPHMPRVRTLPKDFSRNAGFTTNKLFGMDKFNAGTSKMLVIVEGEDDVPAAYEMLGSKYPVVGIAGSNTVKSVLRDKESYDFIKAHEQIVLATDNDDAGEKAAEVFNSAFPNKCYRLSMTKFNDPMEYLAEGGHKDFVFAFHNRQKYVPNWDTNTPDQYVAIFDESTDDEFIPTGITEFDEMALGLVQSRLTLIDAPEGLGKTELMRYLEYQLISQHPEIPFAFCHFEETPLRSLLGLASYHLGKDVTRKQLIEDPEEVRQAIRDITSSENRHMLKMSMDDDPMDIIDRIRFYANVCDCKYFFFEPIQDLAQQRRDNSSVTQFLDSLAVALSRTCSETGIGIITIAHQNDDGQIRDSRMIAKQADVRIMLERNPEEGDQDAKNTTTLTLKKNRPVGPVGYAGQVIFDPESFTLREKLL